MARGIFRDIALGRRPVDVRGVVIAAVGYRGGEIAELQRRDGHRSLSHAEIHHAFLGPPVAVPAGHGIAVGNLSGGLIVHIYAQGVPESHAQHIVVPHVHRPPTTLVAVGIANHRHVGLAEPRVARLPDGIHHVECRGMLVATHVDVVNGESALTGKLCLLVYHAFGIERECLCRLESGAGGIDSGNGPVDIACRRGVAHHAEHLARGWPDGHNAPLPPFEQLGAKGLKGRNGGQVVRLALCHDGGGEPSQYYR